MTRETRERIGVFGGTFDPPHMGHLAAARAALAACRLDRLVFVVAARPWQKEGGRVLSPAQDRLQMTELLVAEAGEDRPRLSVSSLEVDRAGPTYTVDTLEQLCAPGVELVLVVGADAADRLETWHSWDRVLELAELAIVSRRGADGRAPVGARVARVEMPPVDVSSTELRRRLAEGGDVAGAVPSTVAAYARERGLYANP